MSWGTKIVLGMATFMLFIVVLVVYMFGVHDQDALVEDDYYEKGLGFHQEFIAKQNVIDFNAEPVIIINENYLILQLKDSVAYSLILMRPSAKKNDIEFKGTTIGTSNSILIDRASLADGYWIVSLRWKKNQKFFLYNQKVKL